LTNVLGGFIVECCFDGIFASKNKGLVARRFALCRVNKAAALIPPLAVAWALPTDWITGDKTASYAITHCTKVTLFSVGGLAVFVATQLFYGAVVKIQAAFTA
jgi:hypothetical protein